MARFENIPTTDEARLDFPLYQMVSEIYRIEQAGYAAEGPEFKATAASLAANALENLKADHSWPIGHIAATYAAVAEDYQQEQGGSNV